MTLPLYGSMATIRHTEPVTDRYGDQVPGTVTETPEPCHVQQSSTSENRGDPGRVITVTSKRIWFDPGVQVSRGDEIILDGETYGVEGDPAHWSAFGKAYIELTATSRKG